MSVREDALVIRETADLAQIDAGPQPIYLIGGAQLYDALLPQCDELLLTYIHAAHEGDTCFPAFEDAFELKTVLASGPGWEIRRYINKGVA